MREDSCLAFGQVSDVFTETVPEGTITTVAFSLGLNLWESQVSLSVSSGVSVSETVRRILAASGTGIRLLSFPGEDPVFPGARLSAAGLRSALQKHCPQLQPVPTWFLPACV